MTRPAVGGAGLAGVAGVILAAGAGSRFLASAGSSPGSSGSPAGGTAPAPGSREGRVAAAGAVATAEHKLRAQFRGRPVVSWVIDTVLEVGFSQVYLVTGAVELADLAPAGVTVVPNPRWATGQSSSLRVAAEAVAADGHEAMVVGLGDQPLVPVAAWRRVAEAPGEIVTATFDGQRRPPVKLARSVWADLPVDGDVGARALMQRRPELVSEIPCTGNPVDIDTLEDLQRWS